MTTVGFGVNYMLRVNLSIAVVEMTRGNNTNQKDTRFNWDSVQKNEILGIFLLGYVTTLLWGGRLAEIYGTRLVFGNGMLWASLATIIFPWICKIHFYAALVLRLITGAVLGVTFPSILPIAVNWIPPLDRSKFTSNMMAQSLGVAITLPLCGFILSHFGWEGVFYATGLVGVLWSLLWFYSVYDSPQEHPRISVKEKRDIEQAKKLQDESTQRKPRKVPWRSIFTSIPVWCVFIVQISNSLYHFTFSNVLPTYMNDVLHFDLEQNGLLSSLPYIGQYAFAVLCCCLADKMRKSKKISTGNTRKIFIAVSMYLPSALMLVLGYYKCNPYVAVVLITLMHSFKGAVPAGYISNIMDLAPNYSGTIFGVSLMMGSFTGWLGTKMVGLLTKEASNFETWRTVFLIIALVNCTGTVFYMFFGSGDVQPWNDHTCKRVVEETELETLSDQKNGNVA